jgi:glycosyltransferase involved in cell wall biosynthesis
MEGVRQIARAALSFGQQTTVVCLDDPGEPFLDDNAFRTVALGPVSGTYGYSSRLVPWLRAHAYEFDAVIVNGLWQYVGLAVRRALHGTAVPYFVFPHGMLDPYFKRAYPLKHLKKWLYWPWAEYRILRDARAVFFTSEEEMLLARRSFWLYRCNEIVAGLGAAPPPIGREAATGAFLDRFPELNDRRRLLFLGRIHPKKGCDLLIEAFAGTVGADPRWQLVIAGPGDEAYVGELQAQAHRLGIADRITWTGMLTGTEKWGAFYAAEVFCLPSHQENFGIAVAEALACGTPVLVSDKVNIWREVDRDGAGFVAADTVDGARQMLGRWCSLDADARATMSRAAQACFASRFDLRVAARGIADQLRRLAPVDEDRTAFMAG